MQLATELPQERSPLVGKRCREAGGGVQRVSDLDELRGIEASASDRPFDPRADVMRRADADPRSPEEELARLVGLVEAAGNDHRVPAGLQGLRETPAGWERCQLGQPSANLRKLEQDEGASV